ncbi:MAG: hypothetical protein ACRYG8_44150 [Janthinobacterium lividum]
MPHTQTALPSIHYDEHDERTMLKVARIVIRLNHSAKGYTPKQMVEKMKRSAATLKPDSGYLAIGGYVLSPYRDDEGRWCVKASVSDILFGD